MLDVQGEWRLERVLGLTESGLPPISSDCIMCDTFKWISPLIEKVESLEEWVTPSLNRR